MDRSKRKTEKARCSTPRGRAGENTWASFLVADPTTASSVARVRTVSFSMNWDWERVASQAGAAWPAGVVAADGEGCCGGIGADPDL